MDFINRRMKDGWKTYIIYTEAEALERGFKPIPWREATPGDWALSDDGYVGECLTAFQSKHKNSFYIVLTYGTDWSITKRQMLYEERAAVKNWSYADKAQRQRKDARRTRSRNTIAAYVIMLLAGQKIDWKALSLIYRPDDGLPIVQVKRDFKKKAFKNMIQQELEKALLKQGSSPKRVIEMYNEAYEKAAEKDKPSVMIEVADRFSDLWKLKDAHTPNGELPPGLGDVTVLEGVEADLIEAKGASNGERD